MNKNDFWFFTLVAFFTIAVVFGWNIWLKIVVIANSILVLFQVVCQIYKGVKKNG